MCKVQAPSPMAVVVAGRLADRYPNLDLRQPVAEIPSSASDVGRSLPTRLASISNQGKGTSMSQQQVNLTASFNPSSGAGTKAPPYRRLRTRAARTSTTISPQAAFLRVFSQEQRARTDADLLTSIPMLRSLFDDWQKPNSDPECVSYSSSKLSGVDATWVCPLDSDRRKVLLYTHSGGFAVGSALSHRKLAAHVAKSLGVIAVVIDFRRSPDYSFPAQIQDSTMVYKALLEQGYAAENITAIGDSAGGTLALSTVLKLRELGLPLPGGVIVLSPWLELERSDGSIDMDDAIDALITEPRSEASSSVTIAGSRDHVDLLANPLYADYRGFPRLYINAGAIESFLDDSLLDNAHRLNERARSAGVNSRISIVDGMQHVYPFLASRSREAEDELRRIAQWFSEANAAVIEPHTTVVSLGVV